MAAYDEAGASNSGGKGVTQSPPVFIFDGGRTGRAFTWDGRVGAVDESTVALQKQEAVDAVASLTAGTVVVEFQVSEHEHGFVFCASGSESAFTFFCLETVPKGSSDEGVNPGYRFVLSSGTEQLKVLPGSAELPTSTPITVVLLVTATGEALLLSSHDADNLNNRGSLGFAGSLDGIDTLTIGGLITGWGQPGFKQAGFNGTVYSVEVYDRLFTREEAIASLKSSPPEPVPVSEPVVSVLTPTVCSACLSDLRSDGSCEDLIEVIEQRNRNGNRTGFYSVTYSGDNILWFKPYLSKSKGNNWQRARRVYKDGLPRPRTVLPDLDPGNYAFAVRDANDNRELTTGTNGQRYKVLSFAEENGSPILSAGNSGFDYHGPHRLWARPLTSGQWTRGLARSPGKYVIELRYYHDDSVVSQTVLEVPQPVTVPSLIP